MKSKKRWRRNIGLFAVVVSVLLLMPVFASLLIHFKAPVAQIQGVIQANSVQFMLIRWGLLTLLIVMWPNLIRYLSHNTAKAQQFLSDWSRWRLAGWLVVIELLFVQGMLVQAVGNVLNLI